MKTLIQILVMIFLVGLLNCSQSDTKEKSNVERLKNIQEEVPIVKSWQGNYPEDKLDLLPDKNKKDGVGFINNPDTFAVVWNVFFSGIVVPEIDFNSHLVLFAHNIQYYNNIKIGKVNLNAGVAEIIAMETMSARPIEDKVAMSMVVVARKGISGIKSRDGVIAVK